MRLVLACAVLVQVAFGQAAGTTRTTPPALVSVSPRGIPRGVVTELAIEGLNLGNAHAIYFNKKGVSGRITSIKELPDSGEPLLLGREACRRASTGGRCRLAIA